MTKENSYVLATGSHDYERLALLSRLYNPVAIKFMRQAGLQEGMKVLEVGCGTGHMAIDLAKIVGPSGEVFASDNSEAQLAVAQETIAKSGVKNVSTLHLDLKHDLSKYQGQFDFIYGRWVLEWCQDAAEQILRELFQALKPGGVLVYESTDMEDSGLSSYPDRAVLKRFAEINQKVWKHNQMESGFIKRAYFLLKNWNAESVTIGVNQAILTSAEEKRIMRLIMMSAEAFLKKEFLSEQEFMQLMTQFEELEKSQSIVSLFRNLLVSAKRPHKSV